VWEFFGTLAEKHGLSAVIAVGVIIAFGLAIRALWRDSRKINKAMQTQEKAHIKVLVAKDKAIVATKREHEIHCEKLKSHHSDELRFVTEQFTKRIDELQERRVVETREREVNAIKHVEQAKTSVEKSTAVLATIRDFLLRGN